MFFFLSCQPENLALDHMRYALQAVGYSPTLPGNPMDSTEGGDDQSETNESESITSAAALKLQPEVFLFLF